MPVILEGETLIRMSVVAFGDSPIENAMAVFHYGPVCDLFGIIDHCSDGISISLDA